MASLIPISTPSNKSENCFEKTPYSLLLRDVLPTLRYLGFCGSLKLINGNLDIMIYLGFRYLILLYMLFCFIFCYLDLYICYFNFPNKYLDLLIR